jgi:pimeloyl-ACP methyl ester carboxylesterase/tetratricopeptide (TPR) repeat protein
MTPSLAPRIRFATSSDGVRIAHTAAGQGPPLVKAANWLSHLEFDNQSPVWRHWIRDLSRHHTFIRYDARGCGLSDRAVDDFSLEAWVRDLEAVVDALELERFPLLGISQGGPIAVAYAARHPERVSHLILYGSYARGRAFRPLTEREREEQDLLISLIRVGWGQDHAAFRQLFTSFFIPEGTAEQVHWFNELQRVSASPETAARIVSAFQTLEVRPLAPTLQLPALVLHAKGDLRIPFDEGRLLASLIPGARFVPLESRNHILLEPERAWPRFVNEVRGFLGVGAPLTVPETLDAAPAMPDERRRRVEELLDRALDLDPGERPAFIAQACTGDAGLRQELEVMVKLAERTGVTRAVARAVGATPAAPPVRSGRIIAQYEVLGQLGGGGMGVVYKALDRRLHRPVALKFLPSYLSAEKHLKLRFLQEAKVVAALDHPNICAVLEVEELEDGQLFIVMPCYEGETLNQKIARGPLDVALAAEYAAQIAEGLAHAHAAGVIHRDVKPANVIVAPDERVKILDFGIAKVADLNLTLAGAVLGTPSYMSPEQACGDPIDHRSDLWALGAVLYEMLTGRPPFEAESPRALYVAIQRQDAAPVRSLRAEVPPALEAVVQRLLEKEPERRYAGGREVADDLRRALLGDGAIAVAASTSAPLSADTQLERGRAAFARSAWREAYEALRAADAGGTLEAEDLERLAESAWWVSSGTASMRARERAYRQYLRRGEPRAAASVALALAEDHFHRPAPAVAQGWLRRAERHLEQVPERSEHGWLERLKCMLTLRLDPSAAMAHAERAVAIARHAGDSDLEAIATQDRGRALVALGRVKDGMALIDEAMAAVTAGELTPRTTGRAYCNMMDVCHRIADFGRAAEWDDAAESWSEPHAESGFPGICRIYRASLLRLRGSLAEAERQAQRAANELTDFLTDVAGEAYYELGEIRLRARDLAGAEAMFGEAHTRGRDPQPGLALLRLAEGKPEAARTMIERALGDARPIALDRAKLLPALVEIRVACGAIETAADAAAELERIAETYGSPALVAAAALARARIELASGRAESAAAELRRACRIWTDIELPIELAQSRLLLAQAYTALGNRDDAALEERTAQAILSRVAARGAAPPA